MLLPVVPAVVAVGVSGLPWAGGPAVGPPFAFIAGSRFAATVEGVVETAKCVPLVAPSVPAIIPDPLPIPNTVMVVLLFVTVTLYAVPAQRAVRSTLVLVVPSTTAVTLALTAVPLPQF